MSLFTMFGQKTAGGATGNVITRKEQLNAFLNDEEMPEMIIRGATLNTAIDIHYWAVKNGLTFKFSNGEMNDITISKPNPIVHFQTKLDLDSVMTDHITRMSYINPVTDEEQEVLRTYLEQELPPMVPRTNENVPTVPTFASIVQLNNTRRNLPIYMHKDEIINSVRKNQVVVMSGETGCGKSTQVPQYILEDCAARNMPAMVYCTQPRRISARALAERVANERGEPVGGTIGYEIMLESKCTSRTLLSYCTTGILLNRLTHGMSMLEGITHIIIDEVHEQDVNVDIILVAIRNALPYYPNLRIILMSATVNVQTFTDYFNTTAVLMIPGRLYEVQRYYREDIVQMTHYEDINETEKNTTKSSRWLSMQSLRQLLYSLVQPVKWVAIGTKNLFIWIAHLFIGGTNKNENKEVVIVENMHEELDEMNNDIIESDLMLALIQHIHLALTEGNILIFLPGTREITSLKDKIEATEIMKGVPYCVFILHGKMETQDQVKVFQQLPGIRKIIIATNIAETSVAIDDVVYVVDSLRIRESNYDQVRTMQSLQFAWTSKACAEQRAGRAGRTKPGTCFRMCSKTKFDNLQEQAVPLILRTSLVQICLQTKMIAPNNTTIAEFLSQVIAPPSIISINHAIRQLQTIQALTPDENLTSIGQYLVELPVEPHLGLMLLYACALQCVKPILIIVSLLSADNGSNVFVIPSQKSLIGAMYDTQRIFAGDSMSDHLLLLRAFTTWQAAKDAGFEDAFCKVSYISKDAMETANALQIKLDDKLKAMHFYDSSVDMNMNSSLFFVVKAALTAGSYPRIAESNDIRLKNLSNIEVKIDRSAVFTFKNIEYWPSNFVIYNSLMRIEYCSINCCSLVTPLMVALFGVPLTEETNESEGAIQAASTQITLKNKMRFTVNAADKSCVNYLRQKLNALVLSIMTNPAKTRTVSDTDTLEMIIDVLDSAEIGSNLKIPSSYIENNIYNKGQLEDCAEKTRLSQYRSSDEAEEW